MIAMTTNNSISVNPLRSFENRSFRIKRLPKKKKKKTKKGDFSALFNLEIDRT